MSTGVSLPIAIDFNPNEVVKELLPFLKERMDELIKKCSYPEVYMTRDEAAKKLGISLPTLDKYTKDGVLKKYRLTNTETQRYKASEIELAFEEIKFL